MILCYLYPFETFLKCLYDILDTITYVALECSLHESEQPVAETKAVCLYFHLICFQFPHQ